MIIKLTQDYAVVTLVKPAGTEFDVTKELGQRLINEGVAIELNKSMTDTEEKAVKKMIKELSEEEEVPKIKKIAKTEKK
jgi:hypothetical protein